MSTLPTPKVRGLLWILAFAGCRKQAPPSFERPAAPVSVVAAVARDVPLYLDEIGRIVAREVVSIQPQVSGPITAIHFADGADLRAGDPLFTIDPRPYRARLDAAEGGLARAKAVLELAKTDFARVAELVGTKAVSQSDYDARKSGVEVAEAQVRQDQAAADAARIDLERCSILSPIDGRAGHRLVDLGNVVAANAGSLLVVQRLDPIYADFVVAENDLTEVQRHMERGTRKVEVRLPDEPDAPREGELTFLDNAVQDGTGTVKLRATVGNADRRFWPGRFVKVRLVLDTIPAAVLVPASAPQLSAQGPFVYVAKEDATAELRPVALGQRQGDLVVVGEGLRAGEHVVVGGQLGVTPGGKVRVEAPASTASASATKPGDRL
ncbi:MAG TPA: efflux RND transporter periplasmic adaptor subunit [Planctomycetota bacterium]|nr:efflux RND transporter periplasmic adaptor subunit [Planctomycetota bacterium]